MAARRGSLGPILILSAIDVLLCGFSAALALFFVGTGAGVTSTSGGTSAYIGLGNGGQGSGAPAGVVIAHYEQNSTTLRPAAGTSFETIPATGWESATDVAWLLNDMPTPRRPFTLIRNNNSGAVNVQLRASFAGATSILNWSCIDPTGVDIKIVPAGADVGTSSCTAK
jgi:hypothetical protein